MDLTDIVERVRRLIQRHPTELVWKDYHGFLKARIPTSAFNALAKANHFNPAEYQAEIVEVRTDLSDEVHLHRGSHAYCLVLSGQEGFQDAKDAFVYLDHQWKPVATREIIDIPPGTPHGFTIENGGALFFLSLQTPPIEGASGDDYEKVESFDRLPYGQKI